MTDRSSATMPSWRRGGVGLALERPQLAPHLAQEVGEAEQVALGRLEPALRLLAALAELQDARPLPR